MPAILEPFLSDLSNAKTLVDLNAEIARFRDHLDTQHLTYHSVQNAGEEYAASTYSPAWVERYFEQGYARIDPVIQAAQQQFDPVDWATLDWRGRAARDFLAEARDAGVGKQGLSVPIRGPNGQFALFTANHDCSDTMWKAFVHERMPALILAAHFFHRQALQIEATERLLPTQNLSTREIDTLRLLALGNSRACAADQMSISEHTLRVYIEGARLKLNAANTTHAIARALAAGVIAL